MGTEITTQIQVRLNGKWTDFEEPLFTVYGQPTARPFSEQNNRLFGFLADVRNFSQSPVLAAPRGLPEVDAPDFETGVQVYIERDEWESWPQHRGNHSATWFLASELIGYDYGVTFKEQNASEDAPGSPMTMRNHLGPKYFKDLDIIEALGDPSCVRVVMSFDN